jgi:hypothetical protein
VVEIFTDQLEKLKVTNIVSFGRLEELETGENKTVIQDRVDRKQVIRELENSFTWSCQMPSKKRNQKGLLKSKSLFLSVAFRHYYYQNLTFDLKSRFSILGLHFSAFLASFFFFFFFF